jgi:hypothetical protein
MCKGKKVKSLCIIKDYAMKNIGSENIAPSFLTLALGRGERSTSLLGLFSGEVLLATHWIGWVGLIVSLDTVEKREILLYQESNLSLYWLSYPNSPFL